MATKVFFYTLRPYDELGIAQRLAPQLDVEFGSTQEYPTQLSAAGNNCWPLFLH